MLNICYSNDDTILGGMELLGDGASLEETGPWGSSLGGSLSLSTSWVCPLFLAHDDLKELLLPSVPITCSYRHDLSPA